MKSVVATLLVLSLVACEKSNDRKNISKKSEPAPQTLEETKPGTIVEPDGTLTLVEPSTPTQLVEPVQPTVDAQPQLAQFIVINGRTLIRSSDGRNREYIGFEFPQQSIKQSMCLAAAEDAIKQFNKDNPSRLAALKEKGYNRSVEVRLYDYFDQNVSTSVYFIQGPSTSPLKEGKWIIRSVINKAGDCDVPVSADIEAAIVRLEK